MAALSAVIYPPALVPSKLPGVTQNDGDLASWKPYAKLIQSPHTFSYWERSGWQSCQELLCLQAQMGLASELQSEHWLPALFTRFSLLDSACVPFPSRNTVGQGQPCT